MSEPWDSYNKTANEMYLSAMALRHESILGPQKPSREIAEKLYGCVIEFEKKVYASLDATVSLESHDFEHVADTLQTASSAEFILHRLLGRFAVDLR